MFERLRASCALCEIRPYEPGSRALIARPHKVREVSMTNNIWRLALSAAALCTMLSVSNTSAQSQNTLSLDVLSSRPQLVSGGSALVRITGTATAPAVALDGKDVSGA